MNCWSEAKCRQVEVGKSKQWIPFPLKLQTEINNKWAVGFWNGYHNEKEQFVCQDFPTMTR